MNCWALLALKAFDRGKTRLAPALGPAERAAVVRAMLRHVVRTLEASRHIAGIAIVTQETGPLPVAARVLPDRGRGLNEAIADGARALAALGADELLVLHPDLPLLRTAEVDEFVVQGRHSGLGLAPDRHGSGTNAVFLRLPRDFEFCFGPSSFERHLRVARQHGVEPAIVRLDGFVFDVDEPPDLAAWREAHGARPDLAIDPRSPTTWAPSSNPCSSKHAAAHG